MPVHFNATCNVEGAYDPRTSLAINPLVDRPVDRARQLYLRAYQVVSFSLSLSLSLSRSLSVFVSLALALCLSLTVYPNGRAATAAHMLAACS
jgi:hypothetical protein